MEDSLGPDMGAEASSNPIIEKRLGGHINRTIVL